MRVIENHPEQTRAPRFRKLLLDTKKVKDKALQKEQMKSATNKHGINAFKAIREALNGNPDIIFE